MTARFDGRFALAKNQQRINRLYYLLLMILYLITGAQ
jgi:hypothetical protein